MTTSTPQTGPTAWPGATGPTAWPGATGPSAWPGATGPAASQPATASPASEPAATTSERAATSPVGTEPPPAAEAKLSRMRREYLAPREATLNKADLAGDWHTQFGRWLADAVAAGLPEPNAMALATADANGRPSVRHVLLKGYDERGLVFFTNHRSRKAAELRDNPYASAVFPWFPMHRQVVVAGPVEPIDRAETEAYFALRPRVAQLGAWASPQSQVVADRQVLDEAVREVTRRWPDGTPVPAPPHWGGLRIVPDSVEFWQGRVGRLHDRLRFRRTGEDWAVERLAP